MNQTTTLKTQISPAPAAPQPAAQTYDELFERGDYYTVVNGVAPLIGSGPTGVHAAMLACKSYVALGLIDPAREIITHPTSPLSQMPQFQELLPRLSEMPGSRIEWATLSDRFEQNLRRLIERHPHLREHEKSFRSIPEWIELHRCRDGNLQVLQRGEGKLGTWLPGLLDLRRLRDAFQPRADDKRLSCPPYLITGDHLGSLFRKVFDASHRIFLTFSPWVYLVEPDPASLGLCLYTEESIESWCHNRVIIHIGPNCVGDFAASCRANLQRCLPDACIHSPFAHRPVLDELISTIQAVGRDHSDAAKISMKAAQDHCAGLPSDYWQKRYGEAAARPPLRILGITSRFTTVLQYSMRDLKAAFERAGHTFDLLIEPTDFDQHTPLAMARAVEENRPDLVFLIDHHRQEYNKLFPEQIPFVCWIQDLLPNLTTETAARALGPRDFYIAQDPAELARHYRYPPDRGLPWTLATNDRLFSADPLSENELAPLRCDFSFVSNQSTTPEAFHRQYVTGNKLDDASRGVLDYLFERVRDINLNSPEQAGSIVAGILMDDLRRDRGLAASSVEHRNRICRTYIHPLAELFFRQTTLEWIADFCDRTGRSLHLYGNGWESHPRFLNYARGVIPNGPPLRALYQASTINLQIIGSGAIHQRLLDGLASGGFFLIRETPIDRLAEKCQRLVTLVEQGDLRIDEPVSPSSDAASALSELQVLLGARPFEAEIKLCREDFEMVRATLASSERRFAAAVFAAEYPAVSFCARGEFEKAAGRFLADASARKTISSSMRQIVCNRYAYDALVADLLAFLSRHIADSRA